MPNKVSHKCRAMWAQVTSYGLNMGHLCKKDSGHKGACKCACKAEKELTNDEKD